MARTKNKVDRTVLAFGAARASAPHWPLLCEDISRYKSWFLLRDGERRAVAVLTVTSPIKLGRRKLMAALLSTRTLQLFVPVDRSCSIFC